jgi:hypothetical protein
MGQFSMEISYAAGSVLSGNQHPEPTRMAWEKALPMLLHRSISLSDGVFPKSSQCALMASAKLTGETGEGL